MCDAHLSENSLPDGAVVYSVSSTHSALDERAVRKKLEDAAVKDGFIIVNPAAYDQDEGTLMIGKPPSPVLLMITASGKNKSIVMIPIASPGAAADPKEVNARMCGLFGSIGERSVNYAFHEAGEPVI